MPTPPPRPTVARTNVKLRSPLALVPAQRTRCSGEPYHVFAFDKPTTEFFNVVLTMLNETRAYPLMPAFVKLDIHPRSAGNLGIWEQEPFGSQQAFLMSQNTVLDANSNSLVATFEFLSVPIAADDQLLVVNFQREAFESFAYSLTVRQFRCRSVARPTDAAGIVQAGVLLNAPLTIDTAVDPFLALSQFSASVYSTQRVSQLELCASDELQVEQTVVVLRLEPERVTDRFGTLQIESPLDSSQISFSISTANGKPATVLASADRWLLAQSFSVADNTTLFLTIERSAELLRRDAELKVSWVTYNCFPPSSAGGREVTLASGATYAGEATALVHVNIDICPLYAGILLSLDTDGASEVVVEFFSSGVVVSAIHTPDPLCGGTPSITNIVTSGFPVAVQGDVLWLCVQPLPSATMRTPSQFRIVSVSFPLSGGAIAGIVIGVLAGVGCLCILLYFFVTARSRRIEQSNSFAAYSTAMTYTQTPAAYSTRTTFTQTPSYASQPAENMTVMANSHPSAPPMRTNTVTMTIGGMPVEPVEQVKL